MNLQATLTKRQDQVAGLMAIGKAKKIIASELYVSPRTVENTARNIYERLEINSVGELSTWWFAKKFNLSLTDIYSAALAMFFICLVCVNEVNVKNAAVRTKARTCRVKTSKRKDNQV